VGRGREIAQVTQLLARTEVRLVTLTGPGGTGKTRLAVAAADAAAPDFADGVWFVDLSAIRDPNLVASGIAHVFELSDEGSRAIELLLGEYLQARQLLLVLDNFEQVLDAATLVATLLASCPRLKVLSTSRAALRVYGEYEVAVPPLKTPDPDQHLQLEAIREFDAIRLFVQRARAIRSDFDITAANAQTLALICARLDGLPLALELAAARIKLLPPNTLLARLDHRLTLLTGGWRQLPPRQQTLRAACEWSYELLGSAERQLFTSLSVFAGGSDLSAVEAIAAAGALDALGGLVEHNLVLQWEDAAGEARYGMLEILREFGLEQLLASGQSEAVHRRHLVYYRGLAEQAEPGLRGQGQVAWLNRLELEHDNLRAALQYAWDTDDMESVLRISGCIWRFWWARGHLGEAYRWLEDGLAASRERQDVSAEAHDLALDGAGAVAYVLGDHERGIQHFEQSLAVRRAAGDTAGVARALNNLGMIVHYHGQLERAVGMFEEALTIERTRNVPRELAVTLNNLGLSRKEQAQFELSSALLREALTLFERAGDTRALADVCNNLAALACAQGQYANAEAFGERAQRTFGVLADKPGTLEALHQLGLAALGRNDWQAARDRLEQSLELARSVEDKWGTAHALSALGRLAARQDQFADARQQLLEALRLFETVADELGQVGCLEATAEVAARSVAPRRALLLLGAASAQREALGAPASIDDRRRFKDLLDDLRLRLGRGASDTLWAEGRRLNLEAALQLARSEESDMPGVSAAASSDGNQSSLLSPREREVAALVARGCSNREIAQELVITEGTAGLHVVHILNKLGFNKRAQIAAWVVERQARGRVG
jgi:predicted ATPase/DNA-binding CsgD family transcriptional regulator/Tfp pilus assembly protein PilF